VPDVSRGDGVGYRFDRYDKGAMLHAVSRALNDYQNAPLWHQNKQRAMSRDFSWDISARRYAEVYHWARELSQR